jgi:leucine dehydrogenase
VIIGDPEHAKTPALLRAMGRALARLGGRYIVADDVGITLADLALMRTETAHTAARRRAASSRSRSPPTAC